MKKFKGHVNGKTFSNEKDYQQAIVEALNNKKPVIASSEYEEVAEKKEYIKPETNKEVDRFYRLLKKFNDTMERNFLEDKFIS